MSELFSVSNETELKAALSAASGGDRVELLPGDYGDVSLSGYQFSSTVVISSADPAQVAEFRTLALRDMANVQFDNIAVDFTPEEGTLEWDAAVHIRDSTGVSLTNSIVEGGNSVAGISQDSKPGEQGAAGIEGLPIARGILVSGSENITLENNDVSVFHHGILLSDSSGIDILGNEVHHTRASTLIGSELDDITVEGNHFHSAHPWNYGGAGDHGDYIFFWTDPDQQEPNSNIVIRDNVLEKGDGTPMLGIIIGDRSKEEVGTVGVVVEGNVLMDTHQVGVLLDYVDGGVVRNNTLVSSDPDTGAVPAIHIKDASQHIQVTDNVVSGLDLPADGSTKIVTTNNVLIEYGDVDAANHVSSLFLGSSLTGSAADLLVVPGSLADGIGADAVQYPDATDQAIPAFQVRSSVTGEDGLVFDASHSSAPDGAQFIWDFGDGTGAIGQVVSHSYAEAGHYQASLKILGPDNTVQAAVSTSVSHAGEDLLAFDSATGFFENQAYGEEETVQGTNRLSSEHDNGWAVQLGGSGTQLEIPETAMVGFFGSTQFDMSMTLQADLPGASSGEVARVHGYLDITVQADGSLTVRLYPETGDWITLQTTGVKINDGQAHDIRLQFDSDAGNVQVFVDDILSASGTVHGAMPAMGTWGLVFGNPWGKQNFDGQLNAFDLNVSSPEYAEYAGGPIPDFATVTHQPQPGAAPSDPDTEPDAGGVDGTFESGPEPEDASLPELDDYVANFASIDSGALKSGAETLSAGGKSYLSLEGNKDYLALGRLEEFEETDQLGISVDFRKANADDGDMRLVWNHRHFGLTVEEDGLRIYLGQNDNPFYKTMNVEDLGLNDTDLHQVRVIVDDISDRVQVVLDGELVYEEGGERDIEVSGSNDGQWGWTLGSAWGHQFEGEIYDFRLEAEAEFLPSSDEFSLIA